MKLKTVSIQGKQYVTVNERLKFFRETYPEHSLVTDLVEVNADHALVKASIVNKEGRIIAQGTSFEKAGSSFINKTSHVENAETSAWGRALGNFGIGLDESVASFEEVANAVLNKDKKEPPVTIMPSPPPAKEDWASPEQIAEIETLTADLGGTLEQTYGAFAIKGVPSKGQAVTILSVLRAKKKKLTKELDGKA